METLLEILVNILSNLIWVALVFVILYVRDRKKKQQIALCLEAYLAFLLRSSGAVRSSVYPYVYLIESKVTQGTILATLIEHIYQVTATITVQTQNILSMVDSPTLQEKILKLYHKVSIIMAHVSESRVAVNIIVGNPLDLVEPPRQQQEMECFCRFAREFDVSVAEIYQAFPEPIRNRIPKEIFDIKAQQTPLEERYLKTEVKS